MRVWPAAPHEAAQVARLLLEFRDWFEASSPAEEAMRTSVDLLIADANTEYLLCALDDEETPCGVCQLRFRHSVWTSSVDCWLEDLYVEARARGRGAGRELVEAACERARIRGAARIELDTNESNATAIALYEALGFSATSKAHGPVTGRDVFMGRRL
jgi:ribosomal protein S18 acetylase RimI-like enzyme